HSEWDTANRPTIIKPILFAGSVVLISYSLATYIHSQRRWSLERRAIRNPQSLFENLFGPNPFSSHPSYSNHQYRRNTWLDQNAPALAEFLRDVQGVFISTKQSVIRTLKNATAAEKAVWGILGINVLVWAAWRVPRFQPFMMRHFAHHPLSGRAHTMLTATFSHESLLHLWFNMYALLSFSPLFYHHLFGNIEHMLAFYVSAGTLASLGSHLVSILWLQGRRRIRPSVGASGALWALLAALAYTVPDTSIGLIFLPGFNFSMDQLIPALVAFDIVGLVKGWGFLDHAAHLSGAAVGYAYAAYGRRWWMWGQVKMEEWRDRLERK
ncbi:hypothetical protein HK097_000308, partial [Rhizophlyctis rosea]